MTATSKILAHSSVAVLVPTLLAATMSVTDPSSPDEFPEPTQSQLEKSVLTWDPTGGVHQWEIEGSVAELEKVETEGNQTTITLSTDILFTPDSAELPDNGEQRIGELVEDIPNDASINIDGHTDSVQGKVDNQKLSTDRAVAVADVVADARPDLEAEVKGHADSQPARTEDPDDPSTRAANRRVEIVYEEEE